MSALRTRAGSAATASASRSVRVDAVAEDEAEVAAEAECEAGGLPIGGGGCCLLGGQRGASSSSRPRRRGPRRSTGAIGLARPDPYNLRGARRNFIRFCGDGRWANWWARRAAYRKRSSSPPACPRSFHYIRASILPHCLHLQPPSHPLLSPPSGQPPPRRSTPKPSPPQLTPPNLQGTPLLNRPPPRTHTCRAAPSSSLEQLPAVLLSDASSAAAASSKRAA